METDPRTTPEALAEFNRFYSTIHAGEVVAAHPGFVSASRYELLEPDPRGNPHSGPRWLAIYGMADEAAALRYIKDNERPWLHRRKYSPWPAARKRAKTVWRMLWRQGSAPTSTSQFPESIVLVGTNAPAASDDGHLAEFELYRDYVHPAPGSPRYYAIYPSSVAPAPGPDTVWRLLYRYIPPLSD
jgi:hypothetical protein